jgi:tetratricopeptide (TPR) repeat protein
VLDPQHPNVATNLNNLALVYYQMGDYENALQLYLRALDIYEKVIPHHPYVAKILITIAELYNEMLDYEKALQIYQKIEKMNSKVTIPMKVIRPPKEGSRAIV